MINLEAWIDGGCDPNPSGVATYGMVIRAEDGSKTHRFGTVGEGEGMSNNVAEYSALIALLETYSNGNLGHLTIYSDSEMLVDQMNLVRSTRKGLYIPYYHRALELVKQVGRDRLSFVHIPREQNREADALSKEMTRGGRDGRL